MVSCILFATFELDLLMDNTLTFFYFCEWHVLPAEDIKCILS